VKENTGHLVAIAVFLVALTAGAMWFGQTHDPAPADPIACSHVPATTTIPARPAVSTRCP
jgi:hypothetical protein